MLDTCREKRAVGRAFKALCAEEGLKHPWDSEITSRATCLKWRVGLRGEVTLGGGCTVGDSRELAVAGAPTERRGRGNRGNRAR